MLRSRPTEFVVGHSVCASGQTSRAAFTLIELLVVIAIIAILAAILFPVFAQARGKARQAACMSNCKQIGNATMMYTQDYDETYPWHNTAAVSDFTLPDGRIFRGQVGWPLQLYPYIKNQQVFVCMSDDDPSQNLIVSSANPVVTTTANFGKPIPMSYLCNTSIYITGLGAQTEADIKFPSETYWFGDGNGNHPIGFQKFDSATPPFSPSLFNRLRWSRNCAGIINTGGNIGIPASHPNPDSCTRHNGGNVIGFLDGHAKWEKWSQMTVRKSDPIRTTP